MASNCCLYVWRKASVHISEFVGRYFFCCGAQIPVPSWCMSWAGGTSSLAAPRAEGSPGACVTAHGWPLYLFMLLDTRGKGPLCPRGVSARPRVISRLSIFRLSR